MNMLRYILSTVAIFSALVFIYPTVFAEDAKSSWTDGPATVDIGDNLATLEFGEAYTFTGAEDTQLIMEAMGNPTTGIEVGLLIPNAEDQSWFLVFEHKDVGYVADDDKDELDADAILDSIREGTEASNEYRIEQGYAPLEVIGWYNEPFYDGKTNNLTWSVLAASEYKDSVNKNVNHNIRILGRGGYMSVILVADPSDLEQLIPEVEIILSRFNYKSGNKYAEYVQGDRLAGYGLAALVAGGAGTAAAKTGFLKVILKNLKLVLVAVVGFFGVMWKGIKNFVMGRDRYAVAMPDNETSDSTMLT